MKLFRRLRKYWLRIKYTPMSTGAWDAIDSLQPIAEKEGYYIAQEWLSDTAWKIQVQLAKEDIYNVTRKELILLLIDENGDKEKVIQGYLEE